MPRLASLAVLALTACRPTVRVHTTIPEGHEEFAADYAALVEAAGERLDVRTVPAGGPGEGVVELEIRTKSEGGYCGVALEKSVHADDVRDALDNGVVDCHPKAWACDYEVAVAHELGHILWLGHKPGTLMEGDKAPDPDSGLTRRQRLTVKAAALTLDQVCRTPAEE